MKKNDIREIPAIRRAARPALCLLAAFAVLLSAASCAGVPAPAASDSAPASSQTSSAPSSSREASSEAQSSSNTDTSSQAASSGKTSSAPASSKPGTAKPASMPADYQPKFADAYKRNPNVVGRITLPGTKLDYYVAWRDNSKKDGNTFYINHDFDNKSYVWGNPYLDYRCSVAPGKRYPNIVIYGHSDDKNGLQFSATKQYKDLDFYKNHPLIQFNTVYEDETYKVIGMFGENVDQPNSFQYWNTLAFPDQATYDNFVGEVKARSYITMPVDCQYGDEFITLSTCVTTTTKHSRYVTVARKVRPGESVTVDTAAATVNAKQKPPSGPLN